MPREISKKDAIRRNPLADWIEQGLQFYQKRKGWFLAALAALIIAAGGGAGYQWYREAHERDAQVMLGKAMKALQGEKPGTPGNAEEAKKLLEELASRFPGTLGAQESLVRLGNMQYDGGKYDEAIATYSKYLASYPRGEFRMLAGIGKAYAEEAKGDLQAAVNTLSSLVDSAGKEPMAGEAYSDLARLYEESKKPEEALRIYGLITERFPQTRWAQNALQRMGSLKAK